MYLLDRIAAGMQAAKIPRLALLTDLTRSSTYTSTPVVLLNPFPRYTGFLAACSGITELQP
ncbi:MAG: hypothetical protein ACYC0N_02595 [Carboxydocellales bacterium]